MKTCSDGHNNDGKDYCADCGVDLNKPTKKVFMMPAFVIVYADDIDDADEQFQKLQRQTVTPFLYQDESINPKEVPEDEEYHTILDYYTPEELVCQSSE